MATPNVKTRSGNRIVVLLDDKEVGLLQSVRGSDDYAPEPASGIGDIHVQEHVPTMARHMVSVSSMVLFQKNLRDQNITPENGDTMLLGMIFDIVVMAKDDGAVLRKYKGCSFASGDVEVTKHAIVMASGQFNALDVQGSGL